MKRAEAMRKQNREEALNISENTKSEKKEDMFTDEEVKALEKELIETYLKTGDHPVRTLLKMYKKYVKEITLSLIFFFLKNTACYGASHHDGKNHKSCNGKPQGFFPSAYGKYCYNGFPFCT